MESLANLIPETPLFEVVVIDNDSGRTGADSVDIFKMRGLSVRYFNEPLKNISRARNRAIAEAKSDLIAFIDDDEKAEPTWLTNLHQVLTEYEADAVFGPVLHTYAETPPRWLEELDFFNYPVTDTGSELPRHLLRTGNVLFRKHSLRKLTHGFDEKLGLSGGEDTDLFSRLREVDAKLVSAKDAIVYETVPANRMTFDWLARRHLRWGIGVIAASLRNQEPTRFRVAYLCEAVIKLFVRFTIGLLWLPFSRAKSVKNLLKSVYWFGVCAGFFGLRYYEYI